MGINKQHRTALVVDADSSAGSDFAERVNRLYQSLNGGNIKVDLYVLQDGVLRPGKLGDTIAASSVSGVSSAEAQLRAAGYSQILTSKP